MIIRTLERDGTWIAYAEHPDTGERFGIEWSGTTASEATERLRCWLEWQSAHAAALESLQEAERVYHRTIVGSAFASPTESPSSVEMQKDALQRVDAARIVLDHVRAKRPQ